MLSIKEEKGAAGLEFTLLFPFLLFVAFGIIEFGSLMFDKAIVTNAAREGARTAIVYVYEGGGTPNCDDLSNIRTNVQNTVDRYMHDNLGNGNYFLIRFDSETPNINVLPPELVNGEYVIPVTVGYTFNFLFIDSVINLLNGASSDGITISAEAKMRGEDQALLGTLASCT